MSTRDNNHNPRGQVDRTSDAMFTKIGSSLSRLDHIDSSGWRGNVELRGLSLRVPQQVGGEWLVVIRGLDHEGGPVVAFHSALGGAEALAGAVERMSNGSLKWKPDDYAR